MSKRIKRTLCLVLVFALAFMMPIAAPAEAKKKAKKKAVKLSKSKISLNVGKKKKILVKNIKAKKVTWSVNKKAKKKKIVKLSKKTKKSVTIKALKKGKAVVTAKIKKGKKTWKKKVKVTVKAAKKKSITISSVSVLNSRTVQVKLSGAQALSAGNVTVKTKSYANGTYNRTLKIMSVTSADKKTWTIALDVDSIIYEANYVQVTIRGLTGSGTVSKEAVFSRGVFNYTDTTIYEVEVGKSVNKSFSVGDEDDYDLFGYATYSASGLPAGLTAKMSDSGSYLKFGGKPTKAGIYKSKVVAKDELKNSYTCDVIWLVGSSNTIAAAYAPRYDVVSAEGTYSISTGIYASGASGSYNYAIQGNAYGLTVDSSGWLEGTLPAAGTYNIQVRVTDKQNPSISTTATLTVSLQAGRTISGIVKDAKGNPLPNVWVDFNNKNRANRYLRYEYAYTDEKGAYSIRLVDGTYEAYANGHNAAGSIVNVTVKSSRSGLDFTLPVYTVTVVANTAGVDMTKFDEWYDNNNGDNYYINGNKLYLKAGSYSLSSSYSNALADYEAKINATVNSATTTVTAAITTKSRATGTVTEDVPLNVSWTPADYGDYKYYKFVPKTTGTYYFSWSGNVYESVRLYDAAGEHSYNYNYGRTGNFSWDCTAGTTYYVRMGNDDDDNEEGSTTLTVSKTPPVVEEEEE